MCICGRTLKKRGISPPSGLGRKEKIEKKKQLGFGHGRCEGASQVKQLESDGLQCSLIEGVIRMTDEQRTSGIQAAATRTGKISTIMGYQDGREGLMCACWGGVDLGRIRANIFPSIVRAISTVPRSLLKLSPTSFLFSNCKTEGYLYSKRMLSLCIAGQ